MRSILSVFLLLACGLSGAPCAAETFVFTDVTVVDVDAGKLLPGRAVTVVDWKVSAVAAADGFRVPDGATVIPAAGKFLIPGLWDMHVHQDFPWQGFLDLALANGVTGVRDMNNPDFVLAWRDEINAGKRVGPRIVAAGKYLDARLNGQPPDRISADLPDKARELVRQHKRKGVDFIKVYSGLAPEVYTAVLDEAKAQGLPVAGHCPDLVSALDASRLGQRSIEHTGGIALAGSSEEESLRKRLRTEAYSGPNGYDIDLTLPIQEAATKSQDPAKRAALFAAFKANATYQTPTLVTLRPLSPKDAAPDPRLKYMHPALIQLWQRIRVQAPHEHERKVQFDFAVDAVRDMHEAGVPILAGTDAGGFMNVDVFPGFSVADELELFVITCGLTPADALRTATLNPARYFGEAATAGTIAAGKRADLVMLDADPLSNIANVRKLAGVMANGRWLPKDELDRMLIRVTDR
jgi:imidazolonepropionase-like amidohydrolase